MPDGRRARRQQALKKQLYGRRDYGRRSVTAGVFPVNCAGASDFHGRDIGEFGNGLVSPDSSRGRDPLLSGLPVLRQPHILRLYLAILFFQANRLVLEL